MTQLTASLVLEVLSLLEEEAEQIWEDAGRSLSYEQAIGLAFTRVRKDQLDN